MADQQQPEQPSFALTVDVRSGITQGTDGRPWPKVVIRVGLTEYTITLPPEYAIEVGDNIGAAFRGATATAQRAASGLIVPELRLGPPNGHRP